MNNKWIIFPAVLIFTLIFFFMFKEHLSLNTAQSSANDILIYIEENPYLGVFLFVIFYFLCCSFPMPLVSVPTMMSGYLFGNFYGLLIVSFASALGGLFLFLLTRYLFHDWVQQYVMKQSSQVKKMTVTDSFSTALSIRLIPGMPFFIPAIVHGVGKLSAVKFYVSTQLGLLITLFVYVNAGKHFAEIHSVQDIITLPILVSLCLLAVVPLVCGMVSKKYMHAF